MPGPGPHCLCTLHFRMCEMLKYAIIATRPDPDRQTAQRTTHNVRATESERKKRRFPDTANANAPRWVSYCCRPVNTKCIHESDIQSVVVALRYAERNQITSKSIEIRKRIVRASFSAPIQLPACVSYLAHRNCFVHLNSISNVIVKGFYICWKLRKEKNVLKNGLCQTHAHYFYCRDIGYRSAAIPISSNSNEKSMKINRNYHRFSRGLLRHWCQHGTISLQRTKNQSI